MYAEPVRYVEGLPQPGRCLVIGVVNVTPDSFSDGGRWLDAADAVTHGLALLADGADILDVGGESTRPGAGRVDVDEELHRVLPVIQGLVDAGAVVSVDTTRAAVAEQALAAGVRLVNDVSGGQADPDMLTLVAAAEVPYVCMHWRGQPADMDELAVYDDVVSDVAAELAGSAQRALAAGIAPGRVVLDPGLGFAKLGEQNWRLLARLAALHELGYPLLIGASRKRFLGAALAQADGSPRPAAQRDDATAAVSALAAAAGAWAVRVHDAASSRDAVTVATCWAQAAGAHALAQ
jgi:dihydropteroate synthase